MALTSSATVHLFMAAAALSVPQQSAEPWPSAGDLDPEGPVLELSLEEAIETAVRYNLGLRIEQENTDSARYAALGSWGAFDWIVGASGTYTDSEQATLQPAVSGGDTITSISESYNVDFTKPLTTGGSFNLGYRRDRQDTSATNFFSSSPTSDTFSVNYSQPLMRGAWATYATAGQDLSEIDYLRQQELQRETRQRLVFDVTNAYWDLVDAVEQYHVRLSNLALGREQLEQNQRRLDAGVGTEVEVLQSDADVAVRSQEVLEGEALVGLRRDALKKLLFQDANPELWRSKVVATTPLPEECSPDVAPVWDEAWQLAQLARSELRRQQLDVTAAQIQQQQRVSERRYLLDLDLNASSQGLATHDKDALYEARDIEFPTYSASLTFSAPVRNRTARYAERSARSNLRAARLAFDQMENLVLGEVRDAVRRVRYQAEAVQAALRSVLASRRQLEAERARYQEGLSTNFQVLEFQQDLSTAQSSEKTARAAYAKGLAELGRAMGILGE